MLYLAGCTAPHADLNRGDACCDGMCRIQGMEQFDIFYEDWRAGREVTTKQDLTTTNRITIIHYFLYTSQDLKSHSKNLPEWRAQG